MGHRRLLPHPIRVLSGAALALLLSTTAFADRTPPPVKNRLASESSPYLLQHAANPVDWHPWGAEAFERARREGKFIFLSIGYSTCYWCHVMERESFSDVETARLLNQYAVSIKVDREERPDVDEIYLAAVQLMAGHAGWPMNLLLTPDLQPFFGATYLTRPQLQTLITRAQGLWNDERAAVLQKAGEVAAAIRKLNQREGNPLPELPDAALVGRAVAAYADTFDPFDGGFGPAPKFPMPSILELLLTHHETGRDGKSLEMAVTTLDAMARGGIHDQIGGGFHRYATDNQWRVPHFEKMLYDNAQLLSVYARAWRITGREDFRRVAEGIVAWLQREMTGPDGLFFSALDAEVDGAEGASYLWSVEEMAHALSPSSMALARQVWGLEGPPDLAGKYILHMPRAWDDLARTEKVTVSDLAQRLAPIRARLLATRNQRTQPHRDDKAITAWNGLMIQALADAGKLMAHPDYIALAERAASALLTTLRDANGRLLHVARHGQARLDAYLDDHAAAILGLLALHRATGEPRWKETAVALADAMLALHRDPAGGFYDAPANVGHLLARTRNGDDDVLPSGNALATRALIALARDGAPRFAADAAAALRAFGPALERSPGDMPAMLRALLEYRAAGLSER